MFHGKKGEREAIFLTVLSHFMNSISLCCNCITVNKNHT